jgi:hypothetical protein
MTALFRHRTVLTGGAIGQGVATMYFLDMSTAVPSVKDFWTALAPAMPVGISIQVESAGDVIEDTTGEIIDAWTRPSVSALGTSGGSNYSAPSGAVVRWNTATILDGRRLRGRTFVVPLASGGYDTDGTIGGTTLSPILIAAEALVTSQSSSFVIWHRPFAGAPAVPPRPARPAHDGGNGLVTNALVPDRVAILRSRR